MNRYNFQETHKKWRSILLQANILLVALVFVVEVIMTMILDSKNLILASAPTIQEYLVRYLILPTTLNIIIIIISSIILKKVSSQKSLANYIPIMQLVIHCGVVSAFHYLFSITLCIFCFPIFATVVFNDKKLTRVTTAVCTICFGFALFARWSNPILESDIYFMPEAFVAYIILIGAHIVGEILIDFENEKNQIIDFSYQEQIEMKELLNKDQKTGLYGDTVFKNSLHQLIEQAEKEEQKFCLIIIDIDNFKRVNDTYGHAQGDKVIIRLAELLITYCKEEYLPARIGGEEFAILFNGSDQDAYTFVEQIREEFSRQTYDFSTTSITFSAGIAIWNNKTLAEELFNQADEAMYQSKTAGKNRTTIHKFVK